MMKRVFARRGSAAARGTSRCATADDRDAFAERVEAELGLPVLREAGEHGLVGRASARRTTAAELDAAIDRALEYDEWILAEEAVVGREIEVAVLGDDPPEASVPGRDRPRRRVLRLRRQVRGRRRRSCSSPRRSTTPQTAEVRALAVRGLRGVPVRGDGARRLLPRGGRRGFLVNELNTIPGFTPISMYPKLWEATGVGYASCSTV